MKRLGGVLVLAVVLAQAATSQVPALVGTVVDERGLPVADAVAYLVGASRAARTDEHGRFAFAHPPADDVLTVAAPGRASVSLAVAAHHADRTVVLADLAPAGPSQVFEGNVHFGAQARVLGVGALAATRTPRGCRRSPPGAP